MAKFTCNVISYTLKRTVDITVVIPSPTIPESMGMGIEGKPSHTPKEKYPVVYLFHGMGNNHATWTGYTNVEMYAEERNIAIVNISCENKSYINGETDSFFDFITDELPDFVCGMFPISSKPEDTYIAGLSMGGYGTLVHALSHPERFAAFGALSAATKQKNFKRTFTIDNMGKSDPTDVLNPDYDPETLANRIAESGKKFPKVYMACGGKDFIYQSNVDFRDKLIALGADVTWDEIAEYGHEWRFWDIEIEKFLDWIPRTDYYAKQGKRRI
jgi:putative tributyrin esterase